MEYRSKIIETKAVASNVKYFRLEKPAGYHFIPGQATDVSINKEGWREQLRPFTFTSLNEDPYLEFTIKRYPDHNGVTDALHRLNPGDELILRDVWGAIAYKGPGYFIAGGAGITPFLAILRHLHRQGLLAGNQLFFSNKTAADVIDEAELKAMLGADAHFILTREEKPGYMQGPVNETFLKQHITDFKR
ncbi:MAG TPA: FAD-binding oxidoreductase, partial [Chitinophagaceae bacterium]|nr:FAD-binding oxidoreductase [Chitinophagaceae bacterium]